MCGLYLNHNLHTEIFVILKGSVIVSRWTAIVLSCKVVPCEFFYGEVDSGVSRTHLAVSTELILFSTIKGIFYKLILPLTMFTMIACISM